MPPTYSTSVHVCGVVTCGDLFTWAQSLVDLVQRGRLDLPGSIMGVLRAIAAADVAVAPDHSEEVV